MDWTFVRWVVGSALGLSACTSAEGDEDGEGSESSTAVDDGNSSSDDSSSGEVQDASSGDTTAGSSEDTGGEALSEACAGLCDAQQPCATNGLTPEECAVACVADVGTPGADCTTAIGELAACLDAACEEGQCADELAARDAACGGTG
jgi:hypothetical protein